MLSEVVRKNGLLHNCIFESKGTFTPNRSAQPIVQHPDRSICIERQYVSS